MSDSDAESVEDQEEHDPCHSESSSSSDEVSSESNTDDV